MLSRIRVSGAGQGPAWFLFPIHKGLFLSASSSPSITGCVRLHGLGIVAADWPRPQRPHRRCIGLKVVGEAKRAVWIEGNEQGEGRDIRGRARETGFVASVGGDRGEGREGWWRGWERGRRRWRGWRAGGDGGRFSGSSWAVVGAVGHEGQDIVGTSGGIGRWERFSGSWGGVRGGVRPACAAVWMDLRASLCLKPAI